MFTKTERFYDAIYSWKDYEDESRTVVALVERRNPSAATLLDVACGTGQHLRYLSERFDSEGVDLDPGMLAIARERLPNVPFHVGDMQSFALGKRFDVVTCLFSSIAYSRAQEGLTSAIATMAEHLAPGGVLIIEPASVLMRGSRGRCGRRSSTSPV